MNEPGPGGYEDRSSSESARYARLARFDGQDFNLVGPGTIDVPFVHVFVHGWAPGYWVRERFLAATDGVPAVPVWDRRLVDLSGRPLISDYLPLMTALTELGPEHAVLWYSWLDESATEADIFQAHRSRQATQVNGRRLAESLQLAMAPHQGHRSLVHLIGHSHGSAVVVHAAVSMQHGPAHLTLLDAPEDTLSRVAGASDLIDLVLPRLRPLRPTRPGEGTFVDSYATVFGRPYHGRNGLSSVVDVLLGPPLSISRDPVRTIAESHLYPVDWYARSVRAFLAGTDKVGYGWSPLAGGETTSLHSWYHAPLPQRPLLVRRHFATSIDTAASKLVARKEVLDRISSDVRLELSADKPRAVARVRSEPGDALIEFDLQLRGALTPEHRLEIELDGVAAFVARLIHPVPASGRYLLLVDALKAEHLLTARLTGCGAADDVRVGIVNVRLLRGSKNALRFNQTRTATTFFVAGAATGSAATVMALGAGALAARRIHAALSRPRPTS